MTPADLLAEIEYRTAERLGILNYTDAGSTPRAVRTRRG